jgi:hypothetical protein
MTTDTITRPPVTFSVPFRVFHDALKAVGKARGVPYKVTDSTVLPSSYGVIEAGFETLTVNYRPVGRTVSTMEGKVGRLNVDFKAHLAARIPLSVKAPVLVGKLRAILDAVLPANRSDITFEIPDKPERELLLRFGTGTMKTVLRFCYVVNTALEPDFEEWTAEQMRDHNFREDCRDLVRNAKLKRGKVIVSMKDDPTEWDPQSIELLDEDEREVEREKWTRSATFHPDGLLAVTKVGGYNVTHVRSGLGTGWFSERADALVAMFRLAQAADWSLTGPELTATPGYARLGAACIALKQDCFTQEYPVTIRPADLSMPPKPPTIDDLIGD